MSPPAERILTDNGKDREHADRRMNRNPSLLKYIYSGVKIAAGIVIGLGLGGFVDGIALHQIAQWHNMGSAILPPVTMEAMRINMRWDGYFHLGTLAVTLMGVMWLWRDGFSHVAMPHLSAFIGQLILGWGVFNLIEGLIDHQILGIHHVKDLPAHVPLYDWVFLGVGGLGMILVGRALSHKGNVHLATGDRRRLA